MGTVFQNGKGGCWCERKMSKVGKSARYLRTYKTCLLGRATGLKLPNFTFILRRFKNVAFKVLNFKFVIHNSRIYFGKRPVKLVPSKNKQFPSSKGYFTFTIKGWTYYILFAPTGIKVTARRGRKIVRTFVTRKIKKIIKPVKRASIPTCPRYVKGDGAGGSEVKISNTLAGTACIKACMKRKITDKTINGVTVFQNGKGGCWCERKMNKVGKSARYLRTYKTCLFGAGMQIVRILYTRAYASFRQANLKGLQARRVNGYRLSNGNFMFRWINGGYFKMVLTTNTGRYIKDGYVKSPGKTWKNPATWTNHSPKFYTIVGFHGIRATGLKFPSFSILLRRFAGWQFSFPGLKFHFIIRNGMITIRGHAMRLLPSRFSRFPASKGWFTFKYLTWTYYINISTRGIKVFRMHGRTIQGGRIQGKGTPLFRMPKISSILRRFKNVAFRVLNFKFVIHNSRIYFGKRPVKLVPSKNKQFPA